MSLPMINQMSSDPIEVQLPGLFRSDGSLGGVIQSGESFVLSNSNYAANSSIVILAGGILELTTNLIIEFADDCGIIVERNGKFSMDGAELKARTGGEWGGIILESSPDKNETTLRNSSVSGSKYGILVKSSGDVIIENSSFQDIASHAIYIQSSATDQLIALSNIEVHNSGGNSIYAPSFQGHFTLLNSTIKNPSGYGAYVSYSSSWYGKNSHVVLEDNLITSPESGDAAIYVRNYFNATVTRNQVICKARYDECIYIYDGYETVIEDNTFSGDADSTPYYPLAYIYSYTSSTTSFSLQRNIFTNWEMTSDNHAVYIRFGQDNDASGSINLQDNLFRNITAGKHYFLVTLYVYLLR